MTAKPVQIQQTVAQPLDELVEWYRRVGMYEAAREAGDARDRVLANHQVALLRVREMLEAKAREWDNWADMHLDGEALTVANKCHFDLLALAATLGNQGK